VSRIAVLAIGSELLDGRVSDTNTAEIAAALRSIGLELAESRCVGDSPAAIAAQLRELAARYAVVLVTGGLGPTGDDLTAVAAAEAFSLPLAEHAEALAQVEAFFQRSGRIMHPPNRKQTLLPASAAPLPNPIGSAPGFSLVNAGAELFFLPGVPREMRAMLTQSVTPRLAERFPAPPRLSKTLKVLGIAEAHLQELLADVHLPAGIVPAFTLDYPLVLLTFEASGATAAAQLEACATLVKPLLGEALVAEDRESLPEVIARLLTAQGKSLAVAESCTGGLVAKLLTDVPGASRFLERTAVTYANSAKQDWLAVPEELLVRHGAVSKEVALAMAEGMRHAAATDFALAITGIAGPDGGTVEKPVGTVYVALATPYEARADHLQLQGGRDLIRRAAAFRSLDLLRRTLLAT